MTSELSPRAPIVGAQPRSVVIGTAGHIDHGKTALIRALTGIDTDRLPEEKRRGITVDLGFASLHGESASGVDVTLSFIDVPGHAAFVRNMLAGAGGIDAVMLVISAEEGVKPQTEEHLAICTMLGIERGLTVISKADTVSESRLAEVRRDVERFLANTFLRVDCSPIVAVSARTGTGMDELRRELLMLAAHIPSRDCDALPRLPLDRAFVMKGFGTVVTGTLIAGSFKTGQSVAIEPGARMARVRGIQVHGHAEHSANAGSRVALNLTGIEVAEVKRGDTLVEASTLTAVDTIDAEVSLLPGTEPLKHRARVHFHAFSSESMATVSLYGYESAEPGSTRLVRLRLSKPILLLPGDRFVIRYGSPITTVGGGRMLDATPLPRLRKAACEAWLKELKSASPGQHAALRIARRGVSGIAMDGLAIEMGLRNEALDKVLEPMIRNGDLVPARNLILTRESAEAAVELVAREFERAAKGKGFAGLKRSELKSRLRVGSDVLDLALDRLEQEKKLRLENELVLPIHHTQDRRLRQHATCRQSKQRFETRGLLLLLRTIWQ